MTSPAPHVRAAGMLWNLVAAEDLTRPPGSMPDYRHGCVVEPGSTRSEAATIPFAAYRRELSDDLMAVYQCPHGQAWPSWCSMTWPVGADPGADLCCERHRRLTCLGLDPEQRGQRATAGRSPRRWPLRSDQPRRPTMPPSPGKES